MAFNFNNLEEYYNGSNSGKPIVPLQATPTKAGEFLTLHNSTLPKDAHLRWGTGKDKIQHLNNLESNYLNIVGDEPKIFNISTKMPAGGTSYQTHTRLQYNQYHAMIRPASRGGQSISAGTVENTLKNKISDGQIAKRFYEKVGTKAFVDLRTEAAYKNPRTPLWGRQPFIQRGIQKGPGNSNPTSPGFWPSLDPVDGSIGMITAPLIDTARIAKFMISPKGLLFNIKQFGLQASNPKMEYRSALHPNRIYNPLALALQVPLNSLGTHIDRHALGPFNPLAIRYENTSNLVINTNATYKYDNRLVKLGEEMGSGLFNKTLIFNLPPKLPGLVEAYKKFTSFFNKLRGRGEKIKTLSGLMGPGSLFGIGKTNFFKSTSGIHRAKYFLYSPEKPYSKSKAAIHDDDGNISEASKGEEKSTKVLDDYINKLTAPSSLASVNWFTETGQPLNEGDTDTHGVNPGKFRTSTYLELHEDKGNDIKDDNYGNAKLKDLTESKFGTDEDTKGAPTAKTNTGDELYIESPPNSGEVKLGDATKEFNVFSYMELGKFRKSPKTFRDFRTKDENDSYSNNAYISRFKMPDYGATKPGESEDDIDFSKDFVKVKIAGITFRSYIEDITDSLDISWSDVKYSGNAASAKMFDSIGRSWGLKLTLPAFTAKELKNNYKNVNKLMGKASVKVTSGVAGGQFHKITVGDVWDDVACIITKVTPSWNLDAGWDINLGEGKETSGFELPKHMSIDIGGNFLENADGSLWKSGGNFFPNGVIA